MSKPKTIMIDGVEYIRKDDINESAEQLDGMDYVVVRTYSAGVQAGFLKSRDGKEATLVNSRILWYWDGAFTVNKVSKDGLAKPESCKFSCEVAEKDLTEVIDVIKCTKKAQKSIRSIEEHHEE